MKEIKSIYLNKRTHQRVKSHAATSGKTMADILEAIIEPALDKLDAKLAKKAK